MSKFNTLFSMPAIPAVIHGANDVAIKGKGNIAILLGEGTTPQVRGLALLAAIAAAAFNGGQFADLPVDAKGNKRLILSALKAGALPACKGGKNPRPLTSDEVEAFITAMRETMGDVAAKKTAVRKLPNVAKFIETFGHGDDVRKFAAALLAACGGVIGTAQAEPLAPVKAPAKRLKKAA